MRVLALGAALAALLTATAPAGTAQTVDVQAFSVGPVVATAVADGTIDVGAGSTITIASGLARGIPFVILAPAVLERGTFAAAMSEATPSLACERTGSAASTTRMRRSARRIWKACGT